jgi:hypothetical protein
MLAALRPRHDDNPRWQVPHPHRRSDLVDVLPAWTAGAHRGHLEVIVAYLDGNGVIDIDGHLDRGERCLSPISSPEWAHAHEPVHAGLALENAVHARARDPDCSAIDPRFISFLPMELLDDEPALRRPPEVHSQQHGREILGVDAAGAGLDGHDRAHTPRRFGGAERALGLPEICLDGRQVGSGGDNRVRVAFVEGEHDKPMRVVERALGVRYPIDLCAEPCPLPEELLCTITIAPKVGFAEKEIELGEAPRLPGKVKVRRGAGSGVDEVRRVVQG